MDTRRDFIYVQDLVDCVMGAIDGKGHGYYHISSGADYSIEELFNATTKALGITLDQPVEVRRHAVQVAVRQSRGIAFHQRVAVEGVVDRHDKADARGGLAHFFQGDDVGEAIHTCVMSWPRWMLIT